MKKITFFAFRGDSMCFVHVMLNALDMKEKGFDVKIVLEGEAVKLIKEYTENNNPLFDKLRKADLIDSVCKACSAKLGVLEYNKNSGIRLSDEMNGHPAMTTYYDMGYEVLVI